jgi:hypothetical protein
MRRANCAACLAAIVAMAGCGSDTKEAVSQPPSDGAIRLVDTCPDPSAPTPSVQSSDSAAGANEAESMMAESGRLEPMMGLVQRYGDEHRDTFVTWWLQWTDTSQADVVATFTGDLELHRDELATVVPFPQDLVLCVSPASADRLREVEAEVGEMVKGRFYSFGKGTTSVNVELAQHDQALAKTLVDKYGPLVDVRVGMFPFPMPDPLPSSLCTDTMTSTSAAGLEASFASPVDAVLDLSMGQLLPSRVVTVKNAGASARVLSGGDPIRAVLVEVGGTRAVGVFAGGTALPLRTVNLEPGASDVFNLALGAATCDPATGYEIKPGQYELVFELNDGPGGAGVPKIELRLPMTVR